MGGVAVTPKYLIHATIEVEGVVERSDVIGALFGQTEGLLGDKLDLRELQKSGRIGRVQVNIESKGGKSRGTIEIPSSLDKVETALIAAAIETVDKVGPCDARIRVTKIEDVREEKRKRIIERAKELLLKWRESEPESRELTEEVLKAVREAQLTFYGPDRLPAGPDVDKSDTVIIVEGRADVVNLLRHDYRNVIAMEGAVVPKTQPTRYTCYWRGLQRRPHHPLRGLRCRATWSRRPSPCRGPLRPYYTTLSGGSYRGWPSGT